MPIVNDLTIKIGGEAGQGVESSGAGFAKALARAGLWIYGLQDYMSRIRGGHNFYQIRTSDQKIWTFRDAIHMLLPFTAEAIERHWREVVPGGAVLLRHQHQVRSDAPCASTVSSCSACRS